MIRPGKESSGKRLSGGASSSASKSKSTAGTSTTKTKKTSNASVGLGGNKKPASAKVAKTADASSVKSSKTTSGNQHNNYLVALEYEDRSITDMINNATTFKHVNGQFYYAVYNSDGSVKLQSKGYGKAQERDLALKTALDLAADSANFKKIEQGSYYSNVLYNAKGEEVARSTMHSLKAAVKSTPKAEKKDAGKNTTSAKSNGITADDNGVFKDATYGIKSNNLQIIEGIGPKLQEVLNKGGITTWLQLSLSKSDAIRKILVEADSKYKMHNPDSWPEQAAQAAAGKWDDLITLQKGLGGDGDETDSKFEKLLIKKGKL